MSSAPDFERAWRQRLADYAPEATDGDWARMQTLLRTSSHPKPRRSGLGKVWWLAIFLLLSGVIWMAHYRYPLPTVTAFPITLLPDMESSAPPAANVDPATVDHQLPLRSPVVTTQLLPGPGWIPLDLKTPEESPGKRLRHRRPLVVSPVEVIPCCGPLPVPPTRFPTLAPIEIVPVSRSYYPPPFIIKQH